MNKTAELLISLRKRKGWTQNDLAQKLGVSSQAVSKWERGENLPDSMLLLDLSKLYGISIENLLEGNDTQVSNEEPVTHTFLIMVFAVILMLAALPLILFLKTEPTVAILSAVTLGSIGVLGLLYLALKEENRKK